MSACLKSPTSKMRLPLIACLLCGLLSGCGEDTAIRKYTVAKSDSKRVSSGETAEQVEQRMLAAIVPNNKSAWFFKMTGAPDKVAATQDPFKQILASVKFEESGEPSWQLPTGWSEERVGGMTYAKLQQKEQGLTATVTELAVPDAGDAPWQQFVLVNINRWRDQLSLATQDWTSMQGDLQELPELHQGEERAYYVSLTGTGAAGPARMGPFSGGGPMSGGPMSGGATPGGGPMKAGPMNAGGAPPSQSQLKYVVPEGWEETGASGMRMAAFAVKENELAGEVTIISAGGDTLSNVGRWQRQLIPDATDELVQKVIDDADTVDVNGLPSQIFSMKANEGPEQNAILAAIIAWQPTQALFIKYTGPAALAETQREKFKAFVKSVKW